MPPVRVLPSELVNQIAAGEVVERPASVVKELVENAIDAGATVIDVFLENGGKKLVEVRDNGCGMSREDALLALERHATSKIRNFEDLVSVETLGFRGEALPSIASVSRFNLITWDGTADSALTIEIDPLTGRQSARPAARDRGTTVVVRELFENVPARRKFLKSADSEFRSIVGIITSYALPLPSRAFRLDHNGRTVLDLPPVATVRERILQILGDEVDHHLAPIDATSGGSHVSGFVTRGLRFGSRRNQYFFVNRRLVKDRVLTHAANRAADAFDFDGHPAIVLFLDIAPELVDVNVHPAKTEVRFRDSGPVHVAVEQGIKRALGGAEEGASLLGAPSLAGARPLQGPSPFSPDPARAPSPASGPGEVQPLLLAPRRYDAPRFAPELAPLFQGQPVVQPPLDGRTAMIPSAETSAVVEDESTPSLGDLQGRVIGQYRLSYILVDTPGGLRLIDQHVAHERVLYDRYWARLESAQPSSQQLLTPILYETGVAEGAILESHAEEMRAIGFDIERFSGNTFAISAVPPELVRGGVEGFLKKLVDASMDDRGPHLVHVRERICASLSCQAAIKIHRPLGGEEMARLVSELLDSSNPFACPHGRPIIVDIRHPDIERHFHRK